LRLLNISLVMLYLYATVK